MRCDLHVHTIHSGMCTVPIARDFCRECYSRPEEVYSKLKHLGMELVTITDHDSIDAVVALRRNPDFFLSEEVTCHMPSGTEIHVGIYDISERQHVQLQRLRGDLPAFLAYLSEQGRFFSINHVFSSLTGRRDLSDFDWFERAFPAFETRNGAMLSGSNSKAALLARVMGKAPVGGSDAHTLRRAGSVYTEVRGARTREEFFQGLTAGRGIVKGESGSYPKLTADVLQICFEMMKERPWTGLLAPLMLAVPVATLVNYWMEGKFSAHWLKTIAGSRASSTGNAAQWMLSPQSEVSA